MKMEVAALADTAMTAALLQVINFEKQRLGYCLCYIDFVTVSVTCGTLTHTNWLNTSRNALCVYNHPHSTFTILYPIFSFPIISPSFFTPFVCTYISFFIFSTSSDLGMMENDCNTLYCIVLQNPFQQPPRVVEVVSRRITFPLQVFDLKTSSRQSGCRAVCQLAETFLSLC